ncbi:hypothetical protein [Sinomicrobium sp. M5D2P9]
MFNKKDPNSYTKYLKLFKGTPSSDGKNQIGYIALDYQVQNYIDTKLNQPDSWNKKNRKQFILNCSQRIVIYNPNLIGFPLSNQEAFPFENYPVLFNTFMELQPEAESGVNIQILDYAPMTVNTKVQSSGSTGIGQAKSQNSSISNTIGSSNSETNSFGVSVSVSDTGGSVSGNYEHASTSIHDHSQTHGKDTSSSSNENQSNSNSMSIKDWGAYAFVNPFNQNPTWIFGQEYPWDVILCREISNTITNPNSKNGNASNQYKLVLPKDMINRLYDPDADCLYPPSQLSMFGINFVMKASWLISINIDDKGENPDIDVSHNIYYYSASHSVTSEKELGVYLDEKPVSLQSDDDIVTSINLDIMALDVLGQANKPAIIGFTPNKFTVPPVIGPFKINATNNTLLVKDTTKYDKYPDPLNIPFSVSETSISAVFKKDTKSPLRISVYFKVVDTINDYKLYIKHWIDTAKVGVKLTFIVNGDKTNQIIKYVNTTEAEGGENNLLSIALRNQDFSSVDYHDYLQLGLNCIEISIEPNASTYEQCIYKVRAISVEKY